VILGAEHLRALTGKQRWSAQVRQLRAMGIPHLLRGDGSPVVLEADVVASRAPAAKQPKLRL
jgi:hypothetical protein